MWHVDGRKRILQSVIACPLLVVLGAHADEPRIPSEKRLQTETEIPSLHEMQIPSLTEIKPEKPKKPMMFTGNNLVGLFEALRGDRVALRESVPGCPVLVSPIDEGDWIVEDFGVDFVTLGKTDGSGALTYPIGSLCLWTATDE